ncbi:unnamed protein product [Adineta ricciae]|uniref:Uncharacterized protein n=1 Tax=Adineta ricciae TaxID=249248 RepID=A0A815LZM3_ADIRI|nr:unnamed protein product [Adineta ricciae]
MVAEAGFCMNFRQNPRGNSPIGNTMEPTVAVSDCSTWERRKHAEIQVDLRKLRQKIRNALACGGNPSVSCILRY